jgi:hypothetical protein
MGVLSYDEHEYRLDDRLLAHLQVVISTKLRRGENFFLSWDAVSSDGGGRHALWIDNGITIRFRYAGNTPPSINREWVERLALAANTNSGLVISDEQLP